ncbi:low temperature requirement protein A [Streptococcus devriesei]|uniref:low temperature requirement protein A n=1 Tax=Streptococcus devriesei TaxID=231233 RepID=UPI000404EF80|nr:low temperature requirement protein A [Streptococcus devriesei]
MAALIKHKKVELTELFYDLVFVYGISKETALIHHVHGGIVPFASFWAFAIGMVIMINSWMVQTVFTNRFGKNSLTNILFMFAQMSMLLISLTSVTGNFTHRNFLYFYGPFAVISFLLLLQYVTEYFKTDNPADKALIVRFFYILSSRSLGLLLALFLPYRLGLIVAAVSVIATWILPGILANNKTEVINERVTPVSFPHLAERLSLLVIITFGEMIIGIADYFAPDHLSLSSFLIFMIVASLFMVYIVEIDHMLDLETQEYAVNSLIYWHYPIFFGLSFVTVSLGFLEHQEAQNRFAVCLIYLGIFLLLLGIYGIQKFNKTSHSFTRSLMIALLGVLAAGFLLSWLMTADSQLLIVILFTVSLVLAALLVRFNLSRQA